MQYQDVIYSNYPESKYPKALAYYLYNTYFNKRIAKLLDVGCGDGTYVKEFSRWITDVYGIEREVRKKINKKEEKDYNIWHNQKLDFNKSILPYEDNTFDFVFSKSVIEHVYNTDHFLSEIRRVLKPGGKVLILTPSWEYNSKWFFDDYTHIKPFHRKGLQDALRINYFRSVEVDYFYHIPLFWKKKYLTILAKFVRILPDKLRWKDKEETRHRVWIRFCKDVQLLAIGVKDE